MANRYRAFYGVIGDSGRALRRLEADCWLEGYLSSYEAGIQAIHAFFCQVEEEFLNDREAYSHPDTYNQTYLQIHRNSAASQLLLRAKQQYHKYIKARSRMPVELPQLPKSEDELWLDDLVKEGERVAVPA